MESTGNQATETQAASISFSQRRRWAADQSISFLMQQGLENRDVISLAAGFVDPKTLPVSEVSEVVGRLLGDEATGQSALQYAATAGSGDLRTLLLDHLAGVEGHAVDSLGVTAEDVVVTSGSQQFLQHLTDVIFDPGDICLIAAPTYFVYLGTLNGAGVETIAIRTDEHGICPDALDAELARLDQAGQLHRVKLIYLVTWFENPSGVTLSAERRPQIVEIARRWSKSQRLLVLEDAAYRELRYSGDEIPSVWSHDTSHEHVILAQTFSKSFSPGIRVAYAVMPRDLVPAIHDVKGNFDFGSPNFSQQIVAEALRTGAYRKHVDLLRDSYRVKRDAMLAAAEEHFSDIDGASWLRPEGGLYVWMSLPEHIDTGYSAPLFQQATKTEGVMYVPGEIAYPDGSPLRKKNQMRLSFGVETPETINEGMRRLAAAVRAVP
ncbi:MAG: aminotransferase-like domain-containing protein [Planctomycetota bacterium]|jgi:2-aminoadipate transaminase